MGLQGRGGRGVASHVHLVDIMGCLSAVQSVHVTGGALWDVTGLSELLWDVVDRREEGGNGLLLLWDVSAD